MFGASLAVAAIFLLFAGDGLAAYFTPDDMMNLYGAWFLPLAGQERPIGALVYRVIFAGFGLNPLPYRVVCFLLLGGNLALLYSVARRLSESPFVGALACLLGAYHAHLADLYYSTGTIYDLLCFTFYWAAALLWMRGRTWMALGLYVGALLSKEMAVTLPAVLAAYELVYRRPVKLLRLTPMVVVTGAFVLRAMAGNAGNAAYAPHVAWHPLIANWQHYSSDLFYGAFQMTPTRVLLLWALVAVSVVLLRPRDAVISAVVIWVGLLPVAFIAQRGFYVVYLTLPGWYLLGARLIERATRRAKPALVFAAVAVLLIPLHARRKEQGRTWVAEAHASVRRVLEPLRSERLAKGARVLFLGDTYPTDDYLAMFILRLSFRDSELQVDRARVAGAKYDRVYRMVPIGNANWALQMGE
jgi:hypothetical protein